MSYDALLADQIEAGDPVTQELFTKIRGNEADHEERLGDVEAAIGVLPPYIFHVRGSVSEYGAFTGATILRVVNNILLTSARIFIIDAGSAGTTEIDLQYKRGVAAFASIFSTRPSALYSAGDYYLTTNAVLSTTDLESGDLLRLDFVSGQTNNLAYDVYLTYEVVA